MGSTNAPAPPGPSTVPELRLADYSGYDFPRQWAGRHRVTEVETGLLRTVLRQVDTRRALEAASGFGRLSGPILEACDEVVLLDLDRAALQRSRATGGRSTRVRRVAANLYHLPLTEGSFSFATLIRAHHHLGTPRTVLAELHRVLRPGARALVSYTPRPSLGTAWIDLQRSVRPGPGRRGTAITWARQDPVELETGPFPVYVGTRRAFRADAAATGFAVEREWGLGLEEFAGLRRLPASLFLAAAARFGDVGGFPTRWALVRRTGGGDPPLPPWDGVLACPRCHRRLDGGSESPTACAACGLPVDLRSDPVDLRYLPSATGGG